MGALAAPRWCCRSLLPGAAATRGCRGGAARGSSERVGCHTWIGGVRGEISKPSMDWRQKSIARAHICALWHRVNPPSTTLEPKLIIHEAPHSTACNMFTNRDCPGLSMFAVRMARHEVRNGGGGKREKWINIDVISIYTRSFGVVMQRISYKIGKGRSLGCFSQKGTDVDSPLCLARYFSIEDRSPIMKTCAHPCVFLHFIGSSKRRSFYLRFIEDMLIWIPIYPSSARPVAHTAQ